jgi:hypothetical protein
MSESQETKMNFVLCGHEVRVRQAPHLPYAGYVLQVIVQFGNIVICKAPWADADGKFAETWYVISDVEVVGAGHRNALEHGWLLDRSLALWDCLTDIPELSPQLQQALEKRRKQVYYEFRRATGVESYPKPSTALALATKI